jgi:D-serine deaminase-like pyridoxal phosphate-dependent protein
MDLTTLPSPALIVDMSIFDFNVASADALCATKGKKLRPHVKTHRTPALALRQLTPMTTGLTCATVGEAEVMAAASARDVLIANEVADRTKIERIAALARQTTVTVAVDAPEPTRALGAAAVAAGSTVGVLVDIDVGLSRCGVASTEAAVRLGHVVTRTPGLRLAGLMGYEGRRRASDAHRSALIARAYGRLAEAKDAFDRVGLAAQIISSAGTSTLHEALADPVITEIQAGTYALMEANLQGLELPFEPATLVAATVISRSGRRVVLDVGRKSIAGDYGPPEPLLQGATVTGFHEEHTTLRFDEGATMPELGDRVLLRPEHVRLTFNLNDVAWLSHPVGGMEEVQVAARGRSW